jgi:hypothetical protein
MKDGFGDRNMMRGPGARRHRQSGPSQRNGHPSGGRSDYSLKSKGKYYSATGSSHSFEPASAWLAHFSTSGSLRSPVIANTLDHHLAQRNNDQILLPPTSGPEPSTWLNHWFDVFLLHADSAATFYQLWRNGRPISNGVSFQQ